MNGVEDPGRWTPWWDGSPKPSECGPLLHLPVVPSFDKPCRVWVDSELRPYSPFPDPVGVIGSPNVVGSHSTVLLHNIPDADAVSSIGYLIFGSLAHAKQPPLLSDHRYRCNQIRALPPPAVSSLSIDSNPHPTRSTLLSLLLFFFFFCERFPSK